MLHRSRWTLISFLLLLALVVPTNLVQAQSSPQAPTDKLVAPAVPDEVAEVVKLRESLTADQMSKIQAIVASYKAELQQISSDLAGLEAPPSVEGKKLFLPLVNANGNTQSQEKAPDLTITPEKAKELGQITLRLLTLQDKINQEVGAQLTSAQAVVYAKNAAKLKSMGQAIASKVQSMATPQSPTETGAQSDCYYAAYYAGYANYWSWYEYYYAYYDYLYYYYYYNYGNSYAYYDYIYAYNAYYYTQYGLLYAGAAYWDSYSPWGYDRYNWASTAADNLSSAYSWEYYAYWYGWYSYYYNGSYYGYYSYYYSYYYARYYEKLAHDYAVKCS